MNKTARDWDPRTHEQTAREWDPRTHEKTAREWDPRTHEERAQPTAGKSSGLIVREVGKDASENPRMVRESDVSYQGEEARIERPCW